MLFWPRTRKKMWLPPSGEVTERTRNPSSSRSLRLAELCEQVQGERVFALDAEALRLEAHLEVVGEDVHGPPVVLVPVRLAASRGVEEDLQPLVAVEEADVLGVALVDGVGEGAAAGAEGHEGVADPR